jgi:hypothetical protein
MRTDLETIVVDIRWNYGHTRADWLLWERLVVHPHELVWPRWFGSRG